MTQQLSKNLKRSEVACRCGCGFDNLTQQTIDTFQTIRDFIGRPIAIISGCRCARHNSTVGGAASSAHITGQALDLSISGMTSRQFGDEIKRCHAAGLIPNLRYCYLIGANTVHIGTDDRQRSGIWGW